MVPKVDGSNPSRHPEVSNWQSNDCQLLFLYNGCQQRIQIAAKWEENPYHQNDKQQKQYKDDGWLQLSFLVLVHSKLYDFFLQGYMQSTKDYPDDVSDCLHCLLLQSFCILDVFREGKVAFQGHSLWKTYVYSENYRTFASWFWKESPVKVHLAVLNWEQGCESSTVPQQWTPLWLLSINAIGYLPEKALGSGGKSEDQPSSVKMPLHHDVWCRQAQVFYFCGLWNMNQLSSCTTAVRLLLKR